MDVSTPALRALGAIGRRYPAAWSQLASLRADRKELGDWPAWCFCPMAGAHAIVSAAPGGEPLDISAVAALGPWRETQGVYAFDPDLLASLIDTDLDGEIPLDVLYRLPEWCVYVPTPGVVMLGEALDGFFAHLEADANERGRVELRLLLAYPDGRLVPVPLHVWMPGGIVGAARRFAEEAAFQGAQHGVPLSAADQADAATGAASVAPLVSLILYLCSDDAEIVDPKRVGRRPTYRHPDAKPGKPAPHPTVWQVGRGLGERLREARERMGPKAHVRRAHWHGYWTGPMAGPRTLELRWLSPILVGG